jgi:hypothetical protein
MRSRCVVLLLGSLALFGAVLSSGPAFGRSSQDSALRGVPLWRALPTKAFVALGEEEARKSRWVAFAYRSPGSKRRDRLCLQIATAWILPHDRLGASPGTRECGSVRPEAVEPVAAEGPIRGSDRSVIVVATGSDATGIGVTVKSGALLHAPARTIRGPRAAKALTSTFRYAVFVVSGDGCIRQISGERSDGTMAFETKEESCSRGS